MFLHVKFSFFATVVLIFPPRSRKDQELALLSFQGHFSDTLLSVPNGSTRASVYSYSVGLIKTERARVQF